MHLTAYLCRLQHQRPTCHPAAAEGQRAGCRLSLLPSQSSQLWSASSSGDRCPGSSPGEKGTVVSTWRGWRLLKVARTASAECYAQTCVASPSALKHPSRSVPSSARPSAALAVGDVWCRLQACIFFSSRHAQLGYWCRSRPTVLTRRLVHCLLERNTSCFVQVVIQAVTAATLCSSLPLGRAVCRLRLELRPLRQLTWSAAHCLKLPQRGSAPSCKLCGSCVSTLQVPATVVLVLAERRTAANACVQAFAIITLS